MTYVSGQSENGRKETLAVFFQFPVHLLVQASEILGFLGLLGAGICEVPKVLLQDLSVSFVAQSILTFQLQYSILEDDELVLTI
jgi:ABC-type sugar transport system ATPase subunit